METIKINKWDSKKIHYSCDKEDTMDMCFYIDGTKIPVKPTETEWEDDKENEFIIEEELSEELGVGKHIVSIRLNGEWVEKIKLIISNPEEDEEDNED